MSTSTKNSDDVVAVESAERGRTLLELKVLRSSLKGSITRIKNLVLAKGDSFSASDLECRMGILESYFKQVLNVQLSIERFNIEEEVDTNDKFRAEVEESYIMSKAKIMTLLATSKESSESFNASLFHQQPIGRPKLEQIKLPTFSGKFSEYPNFIGLFKRLVDKDETLDNLEKLNYLKRSLTGTALGAIKEFDMIGPNYRKALERLEKRFDNKCLMFQEHINSLFAIPKVLKASSDSLRNLEDSFNTHLKAMLSIGTYQNITHAMLISLALDRVDVETQSKWQDTMDYSAMPSWEEFVKVLDRRCQNLEAKEAKMHISENHASSNSSKVNHRWHNGSRGIRPITLATQSVQCVFCGARDHQIEGCTEFQNLPVVSRFYQAKSLVLCINCLQKGHSVRRCSKPKCTICSLPHHRLLHRFSPESNHNEGPIEESSTTSQTTLVGRTGNQVVLATALIEVRDNSGIYHPVRALLDSASQLNFLTEHMAQRLRLRKIKVNIEISGIGKEVSKIRNKTQAKCKSRISDFETELDLFIIKNITDLQPNHSFNIDGWTIPKNVILADPNFNQASRIDMLIGAECFFELLSIGQIKMEGQPTLQKPLFGWVATGRYDLSLVPNATVCLVGGEMSEEDVRLNEIVEQFWAMEKVDSKRKFLSPEEAKCEEHFSKTVVRNSEGRFVVRLPFKENPEVLGESFEIARKRFLSLERKLSKNSELKEQYCRFIKEYQELGHMEVVSEDKVRDVKYFCPHQCVLRPESSTTKLRVVFDCSANTSSNISLNNILLKGPVVQDTLFSIVLRFRWFKYALTADISKMYRQILMDYMDRKYQCILWRSNSSDQLKVYQLNTVTYGTTSAPYQATRCLKLLAESNMEQFPLGSKVLSEDFYMDDLISGGDSAEEVAGIYQQVRTILKSAGFELQKWWTNNQAMLEQIPASIKEVPLRINDSDVIKTLGIKWNPSQDHLQYLAPDIPVGKNITKRIILSELSTLFDPLGLINPVIVKGKIILQSLGTQNKLG